MPVSLADIIKGRQDQAPRVLLHSPPKMGKTGWAAQVPNVLFLAAENGTQEYDVARVPTFDKCVGRGLAHRCGWAVVQEWMHTLLTEPHDYTAVAIDTLDWLESVLFSHIVATCPKGKTTIVEAHGGYGKGYGVAVEEWRKLAAQLDALSIRRGMTVILLAHSLVRPVHDPATTDYDTNGLKVQKDGAAFWLEWADAILFAHFETTPDVTGESPIATGRRCLYTSPPVNFAYVAGNRYGLPPILDFTYAAFANALAASTPAALAAEMQTILSHLPPTFTYGGSPKTPDDIRKAFDKALDRRTMRALIDTARLITHQQPSKKSP